MMRTFMSLGLSTTLVLLVGSPGWAQGAPDLPASAKAGQCFARVLVPPQFETSTEQITKREASTRIEVSPPRYEWQEERILVREATKRLEVVPATYKTASEVVEVKPASFRLEEVPAQYDWAEEKVLIEPAKTVWKNGRGPVERVDHATGEIMCLVEEPAVYKTVRRKVLKTPASTRRIELPATTKAVTKRIIDQPPSTREIDVPAEYKTVRVQKLVEPARETTKEIPAQFETLTKRKLVTAEKMEWREILCETNIKPGTVQALQRALKTEGYNPGKIDGVVGSDTLSAVRSYQQKKGLPTGGLTLATIESLGVNHP